PGTTAERATSTEVVSDSRETSTAPISTLATTRTMPTISRGSFHRGVRSLIIPAVAPTAGPSPSPRPMLSVSDGRLRQSGCPRERRATLWRTPSHPDDELGDTAVHSADPDRGRG